MKVSELGEFGLIDLLAKMVSASRNEKSVSWQRLILGMGDDTAAWRGDDSIQLATVDSVVEDVHFSLKTTSWEDLGWKALAVNLSDIAAMGGTPLYALVALTLPGHTVVEDVKALYRGMIDLAGKFETAIIGGNISRAPVVSVTVTVLGSSHRSKKLLTRAAARPGDKIAVTGSLGGAAAGLEMLAGGLKSEREAADSLKKEFLRPWPRIAEGQLLVEAGVKTAIDVSDGLISDLRQICKASRVGARVEVDRLPVHPEVRKNFGDKVPELALTGGEDYELLFTASSEIIEKIKGAASCPVTVIGEITADKKGEVTLLDINREPFSLSRAGWDHFAQNKAGDRRR